MLGDDILDAILTATGGAVYNQNAPISVTRGDWLRVAILEAQGRKRPTLRITKHLSAPVLFVAMIHGRPHVPPPIDRRLSAGKCRALLAAALYDIADYPQEDHRNGKPSVQGSLGYSTPGVASRVVKKGRRLGAELALWPWLCMDLNVHQPRWEKLPSVIETFHMWRGPDARPVLRVLRNPAGEIVAVEPQMTAEQLRALRIRLGIEAT